MLPFIIARPSNWIVLTIFLIGFSCSKRHLFENGAFDKSSPALGPDALGQVYRKSNLELLLIGRNRWEVQDILGMPEGKSLTSKNEHLWDFRRPVLDDQTGEIYDWSLITMRFSVGKCSSISVKLQKSPSILVVSEN